MKENKDTERKTGEFLTGIISAILTNFIYDALSKSYYIASKVSEEKTEIVKYNDNIVTTIIIIFLIYFVLFVIIYKSTLQLSTVLNGFRFKKLIKHSRKELMSLFEQSKEKILYLEPLFFPANSDMVKKDLIRLRTRDLADIVIELHKIFSPPNKMLKRYVRNSFRNSKCATVIEIETKISDYEFLFLIALIEEMIDISKQADENESFQSDCNEMKKMINDLKNIFQ